MCINPNIGNGRRRPCGWMRPSDVARKFGTQLKPIGIAVYTILASHANNNTWEWSISHERIAEEIGASRRAVMNAVNQLESMGLLHVTHHRNHANRYRMPAPVVIVGRDQPEHAVSGGQEMPTGGQEMPTGGQEMPMNYMPITNSQAQQQAAAAAVVESLDNKALIDALTLPGRLPRELAEQYVATDPDKVRVMLATLASANDIESEIAALRSMWKVPAEWGMVKTDTGWRSTEVQVMSREQQEQERTAKLIQRRAEFAAQDATKSTRSIWDMHAEQQAVGGAA